MQFIRKALESLNLKGDKKPTQAHAAVIRDLERLSEESRIRVALPLPPESPSAAEELKTPLGELRALINKILADAKSRADAFQAIERNDESFSHYVALAKEKCESILENFQKITALIEGETNPETKRRLEYEMSLTKLRVESAVKRAEKILTKLAEKETTELSTTTNEANGPRP
jgi:hypothetical protein